MQTKKTSLTKILLAGATMIAFFASCDSKKNNNDKIIDEIFNDSLSETITNQPDTLLTEIVSYNKKKKLTPDGEKLIEFKATLCYPLKKNSDSLSIAIRKWASKQVSGSNLDYENRPKMFNGNLSDGKEMEKFYSKTFFSQAENDIADIMSDSPELEASYMPSYSFDITIKKEYENDKYISFMSDAYIYTGGVHGGLIGEYATFIKTSGKIVTWEYLFPKKNIAKLRAIIKTELRKYFSQNGENNMEESLMLPEESKGILPLPQANPMLSPIGITFMYNQYEIAPYVCGRPCGDIKLEAFESLLSAEGKKLIEHTK